MGATALKSCFKCGAVKPIDDFYAHPQMGDGHLGKCKECTKRDATETRSKRIDHYRAYDRARGSRRTQEAHARWVENNPEKYRAHIALSNAVRDGKIGRAVCMICGREDSHGHHDNYGRPLDVTWLCPVHHFERHKSLGTYGPF